MVLAALLFLPFAAAIAMALCARASRGVHVAIAAGGL